MTESTSLLVTGQNNTCLASVGCTIFAPMGSLFCFRFIFCCNLNQDIWTFLFFVSLVRHLKH